MRLRPSSLDRRNRGRRTRGFTLLELLVAISVLAMVSTIAWRGLDTLVATRARLAPQTEDVRAVLVTVGQLERDLSQVAVPTLFALTSTPVKVRTAGSGQSLEVLRRAPDQPDAPATRLQRVTWQVLDQTLVRQSTVPLAALRAVDASEIATARLLEGVKSLQVRVWRGTEGWVLPGPAEADAPLPGDPAAQLAPGVEIQIERLDGTRFRRVMLVG